MNPVAKLSLAESNSTRVVIIIMRIACRRQAQCLNIQNVLTYEFSLTPWLYPLDI